MEAFKVQLSTYNEAFAGDMLYAETARVLREMADKIEHGAIQGLVHDKNGHCIGQFTFQS